MPGQTARRESCDSSAANNSKEICFNLSKTTKPATWKAALGHTWIIYSGEIGTEIEEFVMYCIQESVDPRLLLRERFKQNIKG